jgi:hypothetical protein
MFIFVVQPLQNKWNEIHMKQLVGGKHMENDCFPRTLKFEMYPLLLALLQKAWALPCHPKYAAT